MNKLKVGDWIASKRPDVWNFEPQKIAPISSNFTGIIGKVFLKSGTTLAILAYNDPDAVLLEDWDKYGLEYE